MGETLCVEFIQIQMTFICEKRHLVETYSSERMSDLGPSHRCSEGNLRIGNLVYFALLHSYCLLYFWLSR